MEIKFQEDNQILENTGFIRPKIKFFGSKKDWRLGDGNMMLGRTVLRPDGQWSDVISKLKLEPQNQYFETMHCWIWNTIKIVTVLLYEKFGIKTDYSERYNGVLGGATMQGGSPHEGCESIRKDGLIDQSILPWTPDLNTFWKYSAPRPASEMKRLYGDYGEKWLYKYSFAHTWLIYPYWINAIKGKIKSWFGIDDLGASQASILIENLKYSPIGVAVYAWQTDSNGLCYINSNQYENHWTVLVGYVLNQYWIVYDSYLNCWRKLRWDYKFRYAKGMDIGESDKASIDARHIVTTMYGDNVKGDESSGIYYIWNGYKHPYPSMEEYKKICDRFLEGKTKYTTVRQAALDLIPEAKPMSYDDIVAIKPLETVTHT